MKKILFIALLAIGCSKSTDKPKDKAEVKGTYQMAITSDFYGDEGTKLFSRDPKMEIYQYTFENGKVTGEGPAITGTYTISDGSMSVNWIDKYNNESFTGVLDLQSSGKFVVTTTSQTDQYFDGTHITKAVFIRTFTK